MDCTIYVAKNKDDDQLCGTCSSDGPIIDYNRKSVGLGLPIATIDSKKSAINCNRFWYPEYM